MTSNNFLEYGKPRKIAFEINWPLIDSRLYVNLCKVQWAVLATIQVKSISSICNKNLNFALNQQGCRENYHVLDTEHQYTEL